MKNLSGRCLAGALLLISGLASLPAAAQPGQVQVAIPQPIPSDAIRIPCCRCLDGARRTVDINTRTAPWRVALPGSAAFQPVVAAANPAWAPVPPAGWVGPAGNPTTVGDYTYQLRIYVPRCIIPARITIAGRFGADNSARVFLDGSQIAASQGTPNYGFLPGGITPFSAPPGSGTLSPGLHTLRVVVRNIGGPTGMILQGAITVACPRELEYGPHSLEPAPDQPADVRAVEPGA